MDVKKLAPGLEARSQTNQPAKGRGSKATPSRAQCADKASLSAEARRVQAEAEDVRSDLVEQIKQKIRQGTYRPDIRRAAFNLVHDERTPLV
ncbi:MAG: flagellar biosynthesis anti-sigma factor FlgM [Desulfovibrionaceae bacterium]|jgi:negative regulator of flagellin synthesis FlgM